MSQTTPFIEYANIGDVKVVAKYDLESYQQGAMKFAKWLCQSKYREINNATFSWYDNKGIDHMVSIDEVIAEWQKEGRE